MKLRAALVVVPIAMLVAGCGSGSSSSSGGTTTTSALTSSGSAPSTDKAPSAPVKTTGKATKSNANSPTSTSTSKASPAPAKRKPEEELGHTPFLAAAGSGFGAFHAYISKPLRRHTLKQGGNAHVISTAAEAASYAVREVAAAARAAEGSSELQSLVGGFHALGQRLSLISSGLASGQVDVAAIVAARTEVTQLSLEALHAGQAIQEVPPKLP